MTVAIITKYIGATNYKPGRIQAKTMGAPTGYKAPSITISYDHGLSTNENHNKAAEALAAKLAWRGQWLAGDTTDGYVYVNAGSFAFGAPDVTDSNAYAFTITTEEPTR